MSTLRRKSPGDLGRKPQRDLYVLQEAVSTEAAKTEKYHAGEAPAGGRGGQYMRCCDCEFRHLCNETEIVLTACVFGDTPEEAEAALRREQDGQIKP